jgi:hypothetical protein
LNGGGGGLFLQIESATAKADCLVLDLTTPDQYFVEAMLNAVQVADNQKVLSKQNQLNE